jgi:hypothetical protein
MSTSLFARTFPLFLGAVSCSSSEDIKITSLRREVLSDRGVSTRVRGADVGVGPASTGSACGWAASCSKRRLDSIFLLLVAASSLVGRSQPGAFDFHAKGRLALTGAVLVGGTGGVQSHAGSSMGGLVGDVPWGVF